MTSRTDPISPALDATLARTASAVRRIGARHGLSGQDVDALFQEVRIRLWKALASGERIAEATASYVYRTASSAAVDLIRRRRARPEEELDTTRESTWMTSGDADPEALIERSELAEQVGHAVDELMDSRRPVVRMYLKGYNTQETADLMGWTEAKARNLLYRGLSDLRGKLGELGIGPEMID